jgi:serine/threonine protein kinase
VVKLQNVMYNQSGSFIALGLEDLSSLETFYSLCESMVLSQFQALLLARNCARGLAELHSLGLVHGDFASENILVDRATMEVKIIDFDISSMEGSQMQAGGNLDFISGPMTEAISKELRVTTEFQTDLYALALCCFLVLGDGEKKFFTSLSEEGMAIGAKEELAMEYYVGSTLVTDLLKGEIDAKTAAEGFNQLLRVYRM